MVREIRGIEEVWSKIGDFQHVFLATVEGDQPRVRPVTLIRFDGKFWVTTDSCSGKVEQVRNNPKVEFSFVFKRKDMDCCIRVAGLARKVEDKEAKAKLAKHCDFFKEHWKSSDDPDYTLLEIRPVEVVYVAPDKTESIKL